MLLITCRSIPIRNGEPSARLTSFSRQWTGAGSNRRHMDFQSTPQRGLGQGGASLIKTTLLLQLAVGPREANLRVDRVGDPPLDLLPQLWAPPGAADRRGRRLFDRRARTRKIERPLDPFYRTFG